MSTQLNLKEIERKAYNSMYQDGLWDLYYGVIVIAMAAFVYRPPEGYSPLNIILMLLAFGLAGVLFRLAKQRITLPRMGQVKFGPARAKRARRLGLALGAVVVVQAAVVLLTVTAWLDGEFGQRFSEFLQAREAMDLAVASIGALFVGSGMTLVAYFQDFPRGYYIALVMMLAVFLMIAFNQPLYAILLGGLILVPGLVLFVRFLRRFPLPEIEADDGQP